MVQLPRIEFFTKIMLIAIVSAVLGLWFVPKIQFLFGTELVLAILMLLTRKITNDFEVLGIQGASAGTNEPTVNSQNLMKACAVKLTLPRRG
jgi:hypothetical protein